MKTLPFLILLLGQFNFSLSQTINYSDIFGDDWQKAERFEKENRIWIEPILSENDISYPLAIAVIFPELVRYSALRDKMEITLLKALYINLGEDYANFSIGQLQMKPSFAEQIRDQLPSAMSRRSGMNLYKRSHYENVSDFREAIVKDMENVRIQFVYLAAFIKICEKKYKIGRKDEISRLKFLATAYNAGINKTTEQIEEMTDKKFFNTKLFRTENYSYADVSLFWYKNSGNSK